MRERERVRERERKSNLFIFNQVFVYFRHSLPLYYEAKISEDGKSWTGQAIIPGINNIWTNYKER